MKTSINTKNAPTPAGAYSQGIQVGETLYLAGQAGIDPTSGELVGPDVGSQTTQALTNLNQVLITAGGSMADLVSIRVFISDHSEFTEMNAAYAHFFTNSHPPVRTTVSAGLAPNMKVEIEGIAHLQG